MENKKDIGKAFREKLDGLQKQPEAALWDTIKADLPKKERRFLPMLWQEGFTIAKAVAITILLIVIFATGYFLNTETSLKNGQENNNSIVGKGNDANAKSTINTDSDPITTVAKTGNNKDAGNNLMLVDSSTDNNNNAVKQKTKLGNETLTTAKRPDNANTALGSTARKGNSATKTHIKAAKNGAQTAKNANSKMAVTYSKSAKERDSNKNTNFYVRNRSSKNKEDGTTINNIATDTYRSKESDTDNPSLKTSSYKANTVANNGGEFNSTNHAEGQNTNSTDSLKLDKDLSLTDSIPQPADSLSIAAVKDSTAVCKDVAEENTTKSDSAATTNFKRFYVFAYAGPAKIVVKDALLPDALLAGNATNTKTNFTYGAYLGYNLDPKWSLRTGIAITGLEHTTRNVVLQGKYSVVPNTPDNPNSYVHLMPPANYSNINYTRNGSNAAALQHLGIRSLQTTVNIVQEIAFAEVPIEITYNFYNAAFGAGITGGLSTLFTTKNVVYAQNSHGTMWLGSNKNVKEVSFSGTLGMHFYYKPLPYLQINAEPVFKYYFDTFNNTTPYSVGLQAGLQYNFNLFTLKK